MARTVVAQRMQPALALRTRTSVSTRIFLQQVHIIFFSLQFSLHQGVKKKTADSQSKLKLTTLSHLPSCRAFSEKTPSQGRGENCFKYETNVNNKTINCKLKSGILSVKNL